MLYYYCSHAEREREKLSWRYCQVQQDYVLTRGRIRREKVFQRAPTAARFDKHEECAPCQFSTTSESVNPQDQTSGFSSSILLLIFPLLFFFCSNFPIYRYHLPFYLYSFNFFSYKLSTVAAFAILLTRAQPDFLWFSAFQTRDGGCTCSRLWYHGTHSPWYGIHVTICTYIYSLKMSKKPERLLSASLSLFFVSRCCWR